MEFNLNKSLEILERTPSVLEHLLGGLSADWTQNNEGENTWSPFDVVGHLIHAEKTNWIPRMELILASRGDKGFPPFDRFAQFEESKGKTMLLLLAEFKVLRTHSVEYLRTGSLTDADLSREGLHPSLGPVTLRELLSTWTVHDLTHLAQILRAMAKQYSEAVGPWKEYLRILK